MSGEKRERGGLVVVEGEKSARRESRSELPRAAEAHYSSFLIRSSPYNQPLSSLPRGAREEDGPNEASSRHRCRLLNLEGHRSTERDDKLGRQRVPVTRSRTRHSLDVAQRSTNHHLGLADATTRRRPRLFVLNQEEDLSPRALDLSPQRINWVAACFPALVDFPPLSDFLLLNHFSPIQYTHM